MTNLAIQTNGPTQGLNFYLRIFKSRWWVIILTGLVCALLMFLLAVSQTPVYEAQIRLIKDTEVDLTSSSGAANSATRSLLDPALTGEEIIQSRAVIQRALNSQNLFKGEDARTFKFDAITDKNNPILTVVYRDRSGERVQLFLSSLGKAFIDSDLEARRAAARQAINYLEATLPQARKSLAKAQADYQNFIKQNGEILPQERQGSLSTNFLALDQQIQAQQLTLKGLLGTRSRLVGRLGVGEDQALATTALSQDPNYQNLVTTLQTLHNQLALKRLAFTESHPEVVSLKQQIRANEELLRRQGDSLLSDRLFRKARSSGSSTRLMDSTILDGTTVDDAPAPTLAPIPSPNPLRVSLTTQLVQVETEIASAQAAISALGQAKQQVRGNLDGLSSKVIEQSNLTNKVERSLKVLDNLEERVSGYRLAAIQQVTPWSILEEPDLPGFPVAPRPLNNGFFGGAGGLVLGFLLAYYLELSSDKVQRREEIQQILKIPFIGFVPYLPKPANALPTEAPALAESQRNLVQRMLAVVGTRTSLPVGQIRRDYPVSLFKENFQRIATRLLFSQPEQQLRTICITSCVQGEGKSTCSLNLAKALADLGKRVLLVDADMRRPTLHLLSDVPNGAGLSTLMSKVGMKPEEAILSDLGQYNFSLLPAGSTKVNPVSLLSSKRFSQLLESFKENYDLIIIDTPPTMAFADSQIIAADIDAILFVVAPGVRRGFLEEVTRLFSPHDRKLAGFILNSTTEEAVVDENYLNRGYYDYHNYLSDSGDELNPTDESMAITSPTADNSPLAEVVIATAIPAKLLVMSQGSSIGKEYSLGSSPVILGKFDPAFGPVDIDLTSQLGNETISRRHAELFQEDGVWFVKDLSSTNGVYLRRATESTFGARLVTPTALANGDELCLGTVHLLLSLDGAS